MEHKSYRRDPAAEPETPPYDRSAGFLDQAETGQQQEANSSFSPWNLSLGKRVFDCVASGVAIVLTLPLMAIVAVAVKSSGKGPILFRQQRVGRDGRLFEILKFRTMHDRGQNSGLGVTRKGDSRITPLGRFLRKSKMDEFPQLINVLRGDMSLVGPRPDLPEVCETLPAEQRLIFRLRPGVTGWASLCFRNEEELLASIPEDQLDRYYVGTLFPEKARLALEYAKRATFLSDLKIVIRTAIGKSGSKA